jgi:hypothetical protein
LVAAEAKDGVYEVSLTKELLSGASPYARLGADGVDALFWAWGSVSSQVKFTSIATMIPANGVEYVGTYKIPETAFGADGTFTGETAAVTAHNGENTMFASYGAMKPGDALITNIESLDRAAMVVSVNLKYKADGTTIDPNASTVTLLEQTPANLIAYEALSQVEKDAITSVAIGGVDVVYTFRELFEEGALPVSCADYGHDNVMPGVWTYAGLYVFTKSSVYSGTIQCGRRLSYVTLQILDEEGNAAITAYGFPGESDIKSNMFTYAISTLDDTAEANRRYGVVSTSSLKKGSTYRVLVTGLVTTGETVTLRDFEALW